MLFAETGGTKDGVDKFPVTRDEGIVELSEGRGTPVDGTTEPVPVDKKAVELLAPADVREPRPRLSSELVKLKFLEAVELADGDGAADIVPVPPA